MSAGPVQAHMDGYWGSICDDDWDDNDAQVACRQMGYPYGIGACCSVFGDSSFLTWGARRRSFFKHVSDLLDVFGQFYQKFFLKIFIWKYIFFIE